MKRQALSLSFLLFSTALVQAESDAEKAFQAMVDDFNASGWITMDVGSTHYQADKDLLTAQNVVYKLNWSFPSGNDKKASAAAPDGSVKDDNFTVSVTATIPNLTATGLKIDGDGIAYSNITSESSKFSIIADGPGEVNDLNMDIRSKGKDVYINGFQPFVGEFKIAPSRPVGSFLDYIRPLIMKSKIETWTSGGGVLVQKSPSGTTVSETEYGPNRLSNLTNGAIGSLQIDYQKSKNLLDTEGDKNDDVPFEALTYETGKTIYEGYDVGALLSAIDPNMPPIEGTRDLVKSASTESMTIAADGVFNIKIGPSIQKNLTVRQPATYLVPLIDKMISQDVDPEKLPKEEQKALIKAGFDLFRSFSYGLGELKDIEATATIPDGDMAGQTLSATLGALRIANINANGIGEYSLSGFDFKGPGTIAAAFDRFAIENLEFPNYEHIDTFINRIMSGQEPTTAESAKLVPNAVRLVLNGLKVTDPEANKINANQILVEIQKQDLAIPTLIKTRISDLSVPKTLIQQPMVSVLMSQLNMDNLTINEDITLRWDEASESIKLDPLNIELANIAKLDGAIGFGGILRAYLDDPEQAQAAIATGTVLPSSLTLTNLGGIDAMINLAGGMAGMGPEQVRVLAESQVQAILSSFTKPDFARLVASQVKAFLGSPDNLTIMLKPGAPVPVAQILGAASQAPQAIPDILQIGVTANQ